MSGTTNAVQRGRFDPPAPFFVEFEDDAAFRRLQDQRGHDWAVANPDAYTEERDFETLEDAAAFARTVSAGRVCRRVDIRDDTPTGVTWAKHWDWDYEVIDLGGGS